MTRVVAALPLTGPPGSAWQQAESSHVILIEAAPSEGHGDMLYLICSI